MTTQQREIKIASVDGMTRSLTSFGRDAFEAHNRVGMWLLHLWRRGLAKPTVKADKVIYAMHEWLTRTRSDNRITLQKPLETLFEEIN